MKKAINTVLLDDFCPLDSDQLQVAPGIRLVTGEEQQQEFYYDQAQVPEGEWTTITGQIAHLAADQDFDPMSTVGLFNLPQEMRERVASFMYNYRKTPAHIMQKNQAIAPLRQEVRAYLLERFQGGSTELKIDLMGHNSPGLQTVTVDRKHGHKTGLHYDSWFGTSLRDRLTDRQRIVFNFGPVPRWFLYVPVTLQDFFSFMAARAPEREWNEHTPIRDINGALSALNPPVHCLKIKPGQGYMAPTESVIHDATTRWADTASVNFQLLGEFSWQFARSQPAALA